MNEAEDSKDSAGHNVPDYGHGVKALISRHPLLSWLDYRTLI